MPVMTMVGEYRIYDEFYSALWELMRQKASVRLSDQISD